MANFHRVVYGSGSIIIAFLRRGSGIRILLFFRDTGQGVKLFFWKKLPLQRLLRNSKIVTRLNNQCWRDCILTKLQRNFRPHLGQYYNRKQSCNSFCMEIKKLRTPFHQPFSFKWWNFHFLIAAFTFTMTSGGMGSILWAVFACAAILVISSASVGAEVWNPQFLAIHAKDGIFYTNVSLFSVYLCLSSFSERDALTTIPTVTSKRTKRRYFIPHPLLLEWRYILLFGDGLCREMPIQLDDR